MTSRWFFLLQMHQEAESDVRTGLQSQFSFCPCTTWFEAVNFLQISLSNRLLSPGMRRNSASILWTCRETMGG